MLNIEDLKTDLEQRFPNQKFPFENLFGAGVLYLEPDQIVPVLQHLKDRHLFDFLMCVSGVDYMDQKGREKRFEVCYELFSSKQVIRLRIKIPVDETEIYFLQLSLFIPRQIGLSEKFMICTA